MFVHVSWVHIFLCSSELCVSEMEEFELKERERRKKVMAIQSTIRTMSSLTEWLRVVTSENEIAEVIQAELDTLERRYITGTIG